MISGMRTSFFKTICFAALLGFSFQQTGFPDYQSELIEYPLARPQASAKPDGALPVNMGAAAAGLPSSTGFLMDTGPLSAPSAEETLGLSNAGDSEIDILQDADEGEPVTVEAEAMTAAGSTWNGGTFVTMWNGGAVSVDYDISESGIYEAEIIANAEDKGNSVLPRFQFLVDGAAAQGPVDVSNNNWQFRSYKLTGIELTAGRHKLEVGAYNTAEGQYIALDRIVLRKVGDLQYPEARVQAEAESMTASGGTWNGGTFVTLWGDGVLGQSSAVSGPGIYEIEVAASADLAGQAELPKLKLLVDGAAAGDPLAIDDYRYHFRFYEANGLELTEGTHLFQLAIDSALDGQYLVVDRLIIRKLCGPAEVLIQNGQEYTNSLQAALDLSTIGYLPGMTQMRYGWVTPEGTVFSEWEPFSAHKTVMIPEGDGAKALRLEVLNQTGEVRTFSDTIILDTTPPEVTVFSPQLTNAADYSLDYQVSDNLSAARSVSERVTLAQGDNVIERTVVDSAGNSKTYTHVVSYIPVSNLWETYNAVYAPYQWIETSEPAGIVTLNSAKSFTLPFSFRFFDQTYTQIQISSKGFVQFGACDRCTDYSPDYFPSTTSPNTIAAPLWRDLDVTKGGTVTYSANPDRFVISWDNIRNYSFAYPDPQRFQLILNSDGSMVFQYDSVSGGPTTRVGLENSTGTKGVHYNVFPGNQTAVRFTPYVPWPGAISINQDELYSPSRQVTLAIQGTPPNGKLSAMRFSTDNGSTWTAWGIFSGVKTLPLPEGDGPKQVRCQLRDEAGSIITVSDTIILDTLAPTGSVRINDGLPYTNSGTVTLSLTASDAAGSGVDKMRFSTDGGQTWSDWEDVASLKIIELPPGNGEKEVRVQFKDKVERISDMMADTVILEYAFQKFDTNEGVRKTMVLGPLSGPDGELLTYGFTAPENLLNNGRFSLLKNQLTYVPNEGFTGSGIVTIEVSDGTGSSQYHIVLRVKAPQINTPNDPYLSAQYGLTLTDAVRAWNLSRGQGVTVAVIDTGIVMSHPDLDGNIFTNPGEIAGDVIDNDGNGFIDDVHGWDFENGDNNPTDDKGHGTHVAGIVAAESGNGTGVAGMAPDAKLMAVKVLDDKGGTHGTNDFGFGNVVKAINYAVELGARVINMSLGGMTSFISSEIVQALQNAINAARSAGTVVVASAGNEKDDVGLYTPAAMEGVIAVAATDSQDQRAQYLGSYYSNYGEEVDVVAPGNDIYSTYAPSGYAYLSGTSMAAPFVSGLSALILAQDPSADYDDVLRRLKYSSKDLGSAGFDNYYGYGRIDAFRALSYDYYDNGTIKTQWLETPDENGWNRLSFDADGYLTGGIYAGL